MGAGRLLLRPKHRRHPLRLIRERTADHIVAPLAPDMFIVIHFPQEAELPPITARVIRIETEGRNFRYGCMLSGLPPYVRIKLEQYIEDHIEYAL